MMNWPTVEDLGSLKQQRATNCNPQTLCPVILVAAVLAVVNLSSVTKYVNFVMRCEIEVKVSLEFCRNNLNAFLTLHNTEPCRNSSKPRCEMRVDNILKSYCENARISTPPSPSTRETQTLIPVTTYGLLTGLLLVVALIVAIIGWVYTSHTLNQRIRAMQNHKQYQVTN